MQGSGKSFSTSRAGAFDFSSVAARLPEKQIKSSFKEGTLHAYAELGDIAGKVKFSFVWMHVRVGCHVMPLQASLRAV